MLSPTNALNPQLARVYGAGMYDTTSLLSKVIIPPKLRLTGPGTNMKPGAVIDDLHLLSNSAKAQDSATSNPGAEAKDPKRWNRSSTQAVYQGPPQSLKFLGVNGSKLTLTFRDQANQNGSFILDFNEHRGNLVVPLHYMGFWNFDGRVFDFHLSEGKRVAQAQEIKNDLYEEIFA